MPDLSTYNWRRLFPATPPPARYGHAMVWDGSRVLLFGGRDGATGFTDTWEMVGDEWDQLSPAHVPTAIYYTRIVWDGTRAILFGGLDSSGVRKDETWEFAGGDWTNLAPTHKPAVASNYETYARSMVWDGSRVLMAIYQYVSNQKHTWAFSGGDWTDLSEPFLEALLASMVWDGTRAILFGGRLTNDFALDVTQEFASGSWSRLFPANSPSARADSAMVWDGDANAFLFGGDIATTGTVGQAPVGGSWTFTAGDWTELPTLDAPSPRYAHAMVWDGSRAILFGGQTSGIHNFPSSETWVFEPTGGSPDTTARGLYLPPSVAS